MKERNDVKNIVEGDEKKVKKGKSDKVIVSSLKKKKTVLRKNKPNYKKYRRGVVYLSHIPHGFYEDQIKAYFSQFGDVTGIYLPRSKTGRSKGYAFIEFKYSSVAEIAAETMDNYLMFNRKIQAKLLSPKEHKSYMFRLAERKGNKMMKEKFIANMNLNKNQKNRILNKEKEVSKVKKLLEKQKQMKEKLKTLGIEYKYAIEKGNIDKILQ